MEKASTTTTFTTRRSKWQYQQPPPTPRILHLPRRHRRKQSTATSKANSGNKSVVGDGENSLREKKGKLETLFGQERVFARGGVVKVKHGEFEEVEVERREKVEEGGSRGGRGGGGVVEMEEKKWRFQAEMLRAECNLLRMEREIAVKKMERRRIQMEKTLKSAVQALLSGREKIHEGKSARMVLEEEILALAKKLQKLQIRSRVKDFEAKNCSNFDKQVSLLQRRLRKFGDDVDEICVKEIQEMAEASLSINNTRSPNEHIAPSPSFNMDILRRKMEGLSKGALLERMEDEYKTLLSTTNCSATSCASNSKQMEFPDMPSFSIRQQHMETECYEDKACSGHCKAIVKRVVEQVRAETEQWSQMQEMLGRVRDEMEELQSLRDFWEDRALDSDYRIQSLRSSVQEWREKALSSEAKANELHSQVTALQAEVEKLRNEQLAETESAKSSPLPPRRSTKETEKHVLVCHLKENRNPKSVPSDRRRKLYSQGKEVDARTRFPFKDVGNDSSLVKQNTKSLFSLHYSLASSNEKKQNLRTIS